jgi:outer membrane protein OmpA-like peptidoglycan-associated protein
MHPANPLRDAGLLAALLIMLAAPACPALAQATAPAPAENLVDALAGLETAPELDIAALRQQATERAKSKATAVPVNRPPLVPELLKLPQISLDVLFDPDSSIIRPGSYRTLGHIADALTQPALLPYKFLIVGHTESGGRRDHNVTISQKRADAIRDALVTMFKLSSKRVQSLGLGEEQLRDAIRPTAAANRRIQVVTVGKTPEPSESPAPPSAKKPPPPGKKPPSRK